MSKVNQILAHIEELKRSEALKAQKQEEAKAVEEEKAVTRHPVTNCGVRFVDYISNRRRRGTYSDSAVCDTGANIGVLSFPVEGGWCGYKSADDTTSIRTTQNHTVAKEFDNTNNLANDDDYRCESYCLKDADDIVRGMNDK